MWSACGIASAMIVSVGFSAALVVNWLPSETKRFAAQVAKAERSRGNLVRAIELGNLQPSIFEQLAKVEADLDRCVEPATFKSCVVSNEPGNCARTRGSK